MKKNLLLIAFVFIFIGMKAQTESDKKILLKGFEEDKIRHELLKKGLNPEEHLDGMRRNYMANQAKKLGLIQPVEGNTSIHAQQRGGGGHNTVFNSLCPNSGFEQQNFNGWTGDTWTNSNYLSWTLVNPSWAPGVVTYAPQNINAPLSEGGPQAIIYPNSTNRHNIMTAAPINNNPTSSSFSGYDSLAINSTTHLSDIPVVSPNGNGTSLRIGNANAGAETERIIYTIPVTAANSLFTYQYAVVLNQSTPTPHQAIDQPKFTITTKDQNGNNISVGGSGCGFFDVNASSAAANGFLHNAGDVYNGFFNVYYKPWTTATIDLTPYIGQNITVEFRTFDCSQSGHFGYAYINAYCGNPSSAISVVGFCGVQTGTVTIVAPAGYASYQWYGPSPNNTTPATGQGASTQTLTTVASINDTFTVKTVSASGCNSTFKVVIKPSVIQLTTSSTSSCKGGALGTVTAAVPSAGGNFNYAWSSSLGPIGTNTTTLTNLPPGTYSVHVTDGSGGCPAKDTTVKITVSNPSLQTTSAQLCGTQTILNAPNSFTNTTYQWYNNSNALTGIITQSYSITNGANAQHYIVTYLDSASHCLDSLKITLNQVNINFSPIASPPCAGPGANSGSLTFNANPNNSFSTYDWAVTGATTNGAANVTAPISIGSLTAGTYSVVITAPGNTTCAYTYTGTLVSGVAAAGIPDTAKICNMDILSLNPHITANVTHSWSGTGLPYSAGNPYTGAPYDIQPPFSNTTPGYYFYTDSISTVVGNCLSIYTVVVKLKSFKTRITKIEGLHCFGDSTGKIKVNVTEPNGPVNNPDKYIFTWSPGTYTSTATGLSASSTESGLPAGSYTCVVNNGTCTYTNSIIVANVAPLPTDSFYGYYCPKDSLAILVADTAGNVNYQWYSTTSGLIPNAINDSLQVLVPNVNNYYVVYKHDGCKDSAVTMIPVTTFNAFKPSETVNIFSPNGDKINDFFFPFYQSNLTQGQIGKQAQDYDLKVYNRWGLLVYETTDYDKGWDGKAKSGSDADDGSYFFVVKYLSNCGTKADVVEKKGFVQLMR